MFLDILCICIFFLFLSKYSLKQISKKVIFILEKDNQVNFKNYAKIINHLNTYREYLSGLLCLVV